MTSLNSYQLELIESLRQCNIDNSFTSQYDDESYTYPDEDLLDIILNNMNDIWHNSIAMGSFIIYLSKYNEKDDVLQRLFKFISNHPMYLLTLEDTYLIPGILVKSKSNAIRLIGNFKELVLGFPNKSPSLNRNKLVNYLKAYAEGTKTEHFNIIAKPTNGLLPFVLQSIYDSGLYDDHLYLESIGDLLHTIFRCATKNWIKFSNQLLQILSNVFENEYEPVFCNLYFKIQGNSNGKSLENLLIQFIERNKLPFNIIDSIFNIFKKYKIQIQTISLPQLILKFTNIHQHQFEYFQILNSNFLHQDIINDFYFRTLFIEKSCTLSFLSTLDKSFVIENQQENNEIGNSSQWINTPHYFKQDIIKSVLETREGNMSFKISIAMVNKEYFNIVKKILYQFPIKNIYPLQPLNVSAKMSLFTRAPLHLNLDKWQPFKLC